VGTVLKRGVRVTVRNPTANIAFMVHLRITRGKSGEDLTPIFWSDNYFSLLPGEQKEVTAAYDPADLEGTSALLVMDGYNVAPRTLEPK
jgi:exo-1,4-beta-D-glucosaminidase